jgi:RNA-binding protein 39
VRERERKRETGRERERERERQRERERERDRKWKLTDCAKEQKMMPDAPEIERAYKNNKYH